MNRVDSQTFLSLRGHIPLLDVRSPSEYARGHIPGSVSFPLFTDEERAAVGTAYTKQGQEKAVLAGLGFVGPRLERMAAEALEIVKATASGDRRVALTCWRGGMRSASVGWLLQQAGLDPIYLRGGYKAYRKHVLDLCAAPWPFAVLSGMTGSGKTEILHEMDALGCQTIDLEGLAGHRGSVFGNIEGIPQPQTEHFENMLADRLMRMTTSRPLWVEDESQNLGKVNIPPPFFEHLRISPFVLLEVPRPDRIRRIVDGYDPAHNAFAEEGINRISKRLGGESRRKALEALGAGEYVRVVEILLDYYDRAYSKQIARHGRPPVLSITATAGESPASLAGKLKAAEQEIVAATS